MSTATGPPGPERTPVPEHTPGPASPAQTGPRPFRVLATRHDTHDTFTLTLEPLDGTALRFSAGQFTMVGAFGGGEAPISISSDPSSRRGPLQQTIRDAGGVTHTLARAGPGDVVTVRGPYGRGWDVADGAGGDIVLVAGGVGLAPLRSAVLDIFADRGAYDRVTLLYGARSPAERLFPGDLAAWGRGGEDGIAVDVTVDRAGPGWTGPVGLVTSLVPHTRCDPSRTLALVCGPEVMMRFVCGALTDMGVPAERIRVSLERNMECGVGLCGHCQLRELFVCTDGPVFSYERVASLMAIREY